MASGQKQILWRKHIFEYFQINLTFKTDWNNDTHADKLIVIHLNWAMPPKKQCSISKTKWKKNVEKTIIVKYKFRRYICGHPIFSDITALGWSFFQTKISLSLSRGLHFRWIGRIYRSFDGRVFVIQFNPPPVSYIYIILSVSFLLVRSLALCMCVRCTFGKNNMIIPYIRCVIKTDMSTSYFWTQSCGIQSQTIFGIEIDGRFSFSVLFFFAHSLHLSTWAISIMIANGPS